MKKCLAILLAALLTLSAVGALAEINLAPFAEVENASVISGCDLLKLDLRNGYALAAIDGTQLTDAVYASGMYFEKGWITARKPSEDDYQTNGVLSVEGQEVVPFQYGDVKIKNACWALGFTLTLATADNYDYSSWGSDSTYYLIDTVDVYYLPEAKCVASIPRTNFKDCNAYGAYINIEDRATGVVTTYDAGFNALGEVKYSSSDDLIPHYTTYSENGQQGLLDPEGSVVLPASFRYVDTNVRDGYFTVSTGDLYGLADLNGNVVVPAEYERIQTSYYASTPDYSSPYVVNGYAAVVKDDKLGYYSVAEGLVSCEPRYSKDVLENCGVSAQYTDMAGTPCLLAADGVETALDGYDNVRPLDGAGGMLYRVGDADNHYGVVDWHGNVVLPLEYNSVNTTGDGKYLLAQKGYGDPVQVLEVVGTVTEAAVADEDAQPSGTDGSESLSAAAVLLDNAMMLLNSDPEANGAAAIALLETTVSQVSDNEAARGLVSSAITLLQADAVGNAASAITLLENAKSML